MMGQLLDILTPDLIRNPLLSDGFKERELHKLRIDIQKIFDAMGWESPHGWKEGWKMRGWKTSWLPRKPGTRPMKAENADLALLQKKFTEPLTDLGNRSFENTKRAATTLNLLCDEFFSQCPPDSQATKFAKEYKIYEIRDKLKDQVAQLPPEYEGSASDTVTMRYRDALLAEEKKAKANGGVLNPV